MTDLTEQWKKGELPEGHYYIKTHNETNIDEYIQWYKDHGIPSEKSFAYFNVQQVLAPVPSYEEWQAKLEENAQLKKQINHVLRTQARQFVDNQKLQVKAEKAKDVINIDTARQIKQLKELLKECKEVIKNVDTYYGNYDSTNGYLVINKIDEALR